MEESKMNKHQLSSNRAEEKRRIESLMVEGYQSSSEEDRTINCEWEPADLEKWD